MRHGWVLELAEDLLHALLLSVHGCAFALQDVGELAGHKEVWAIMVYHCYNVHVVSLETLNPH
jgi:hypothetical protein